MERYTIYCTEEQTKKAYELGAPIDDTGQPDDISSITFCHESNYGEWVIIFRPTAEQMMGWLEEQGVAVILVSIVDGETISYRWITHSCHYDDDYGNRSNITYSRKEATLAAIDSALDYLIKNKK